jgi:Toprim domain
MPKDASALAQRLAQSAEAVCRHYLSNGRRQGRYWVVGDARNSLGRSMFVRLTGPKYGKGAAGKWTDGCTGEHGDLLDIIRESCGLVDFGDVAREARRFLNLPLPVDQPSPHAVRAAAPNGSPEAAQRLFAMSQPLSGTLADTYLQNRGIAHVHHGGSLRFHPRCYYKPDDGAPTETWPAMIACVTDLNGAITGAHRTWLDPDGFDPIRFGKAPIATPRRAMGELLGNAVRFGIGDEVLAVGEGIETMLSLCYALPSMAMAAALSANHLAAILLPVTLRRLYIAQDNDDAGKTAAEALGKRAVEAGIEPVTLSPQLGDFNEDLRTNGVDQLRAQLRVQLAPEDVIRFMPAEMAGMECRPFSSQIVRTIKPEPLSPE